MKVRDARKMASRGRVVEAARSLFEEVGFHGTTVRMIHTGFDESVRWRRYYEVMAVAWATALRALKEFLEA